MKGKRKIEKKIKELVEKMNLQEEVIKAFYGMEASVKGLKEAFEEGIKEVEDFVKNKKDINERLDIKLSYIKWSLMFKDFKKQLDVVPSIAKELRSMADELEEFYK